VGDLRGAVVTDRLEVNEAATDEGYIADRVHDEESLDLLPRAREAQ
jgi:hypothetical protein